ncbi:MAG: 23S rRNA (pseudouridine(1915)-N(3))-methyltransferase RlmH [Alphaproteobacteria bacterium]
MKIDIIAVGSLKKGALYDALQMYLKRMQWNVNIIEIKESQKNESELILAKTNPSAKIIALDERGTSLPSLKFANKIKEFQNSGASHIQFIIGGADGLSDQIRTRANLLLSFGKQTWPHMLARVMLIEQIYRTQQILSGHPYHRE